MKRVAFQDRMPRNHCFGCGAENPKGMQIKSYWSTESETICEYRPQAHHMAGPTHVLNGGIIAALIDCHCICTAIANAYTVEGRQVGEGAPIWYATGTLNVRYLSPTPIDETVELRAHITEQTDKRTNLECSLRSGGVERARAAVIAVRVSTGWLA